MSKVDFSIPSINGSTFKFMFEILNVNEMLVRVNEVKKDVLYSKVYQNTFEKEILSNYSKTGVTFKDTEVVLKQIVTSFNSRKATFRLIHSEINLSYFLFGNIQVSINIPLVTENNSDETMNYMLSKLSNLINLSNNFKRILKKFSKNFSKNKSNNKLIHNKINRLQKELDFSVALKKNQSEIMNKLSSIQAFIKKTEDEETLNKFSHQMNLNNKDVQELLEEKTNNILQLEKEKTIKDEEKKEKEKYSMCFLADRRLVSAGGGNKKGKIIIYEKKTFEPQIIIKDDCKVFSVCGLKNGNLASGYSEGGLIKIWKINDNNYLLLHTLKEHNYAVNKIIELEDGRLFTCSYDETIKVWDDKYQCIMTLQRNSQDIKSIIEIKDYIISVSDEYHKTAMVWNKSTYKFLKKVENVYCSWLNGLAKIKENAIIIGGENEIFILDILSFQSKSLKNNQFGKIFSICVLKEDQVLIGNAQGNLFCFDSLYNKIIFTQQLYKDAVSCIIKNEDNQIFLSSYDGTIKIYW